MPALNVILECHNLCRYFKSGGNTLKVLDGVSLELKRGEMVCVVGASGSGKSTLLHLLGLLDTPTAGTIAINGKHTHELEMHELDTLRRNLLGFVFQFHHLLPEFNAVENIALPARIARRNISEIETRANQLLDMTQLSHRATHRPGELSGGEQQRIAVARALMNQPQILFMDEPTGNLDHANGLKLLEILDNLRAQETLSILMVTHNPEIAERADRLLHLEDGRIR